jgi:hypothetical protein
MGLAEAALAVMPVAAALAAALAGVDGVSAFHTFYRKACLRLEDERWLLNQCRDPVFFSKMRAYTNVCSEVETNARVGAFWLALRESSEGFKMAWQPGLVLLVALLLPVCWVCVAKVASRLVRAECIPLHDKS